MSIEIDVSKRGIEFQLIAEKLSGELKQKLVAQLADVAYETMVSLAPRRTGRMAASITKEALEDGVIIKVGAWYARFLATGTKPHVIKPVRSSILKFAVAGKLVFTRLVRHPGFQQQPFVSRSKEAAEESVEETFRTLWQEATAE